MGAAGDHVLGDGETGGWRRWVAEFVVSFVGWRRVFILATVPFVVGLSILLVADDGVAGDLGSGFVGGSVLGFIFAIAQYTLDQQTTDRQEGSDLGLTVSSNSELTGIDLTERDLSRHYMRGKLLVRANLDRARLAGANLTETDMREASLRDVDMTGANLRHANLRAAVLDGADLTGADLEHSELGSTSMVGATLVGASLIDVKGRPVEPDDPASTRPRWLDISGAVLDHARLDGADLTGCAASFVSARRVEALGVVLDGADLSCADLRCANLRDAKLRGTDLSGADLSDGELTNADLRGAKLVGARFVRANLTGAQFDEAVLRAADLREAHVTNVAFGTADLTDALLPSPDPASSEPGAVTAPGFLDEQQDPLAGPEGDVTAPAKVPRRLRIQAADDELQRLAEDVAAVLRKRRAELRGANERLAGVPSVDAAPFLGDPADHGLPGKVTTRRPRARRQRPARPLRLVRPRSPGRTAELVLHRDGETVGLSFSGDVDVVTAPNAMPTAHAVATAAQRALLGPETVLVGDHFTAFMSWLDAGDVERLARSDDSHPRNPVSLAVRSWRRESSDLAQMELAIDEARIAWAATRSPVWRAVAASRLAWAQGQIHHRSEAHPIGLARAQAAGDWAVRCLARCTARRRPSPGLLSAHLKALIGRGIAYAIVDTYDDQTRAIDLFEDALRFCERHHLPASPTALNAAGFIRMERAGSATRGADLEDYVVAARYFRQVIEGAAGLAPDQEVRTTTELIDAVRRRRAATPPRDADEAAERRADERALRLSLINLGNLCRLFRRYDDAIACAMGSAESDPDYREAYTEHAAVYLDLGRPHDADALIERMLDCQGGTPPQVVRNLVRHAESLEQVGWWAYQRPWLLAALAHVPDSPSTRKLLDRWEARAGLRPTPDAAEPVTPMTAPTFDDGAAVPAADWPAPRRRPETYPGAAPDFPYLLLGDDVHRLDVRLLGDTLRVTMTDGTPLDDVLRSVGAPTLAERVLSIAYGANRGPASLALKLAHHGHGRPGTDPDGQGADASATAPPVPAVPVLAGSLDGVDVVAAGITSQGFIYSDLVDSPGTRVQIMAALLDRSQLIAIHDSEDVGRAYDCAWLDGFTPAGSDGSLSGLAYVGRRSIFHVPIDDAGDDAGQPLAFSTIAATGRRYPERDQMEIFTRVVESTGIVPQLLELLPRQRSTSPEAVAREVMRVLNGQWWYVHHTGDVRSSAAVEVERTLAEAMLATSSPRPATSPLTRSVLSPERAYNPDHDSLLGAQVELP